MIQAAEEARSLVGNRVLLTSGATANAGPLLWNFTVLGEAAAQLDDEVRGRFPDVGWDQPARLRNRALLTRMWAGRTALALQ